MARRTVEEVIQPALDHYGAELDAHGHDDERGGCVCGWKPKRRTSADPLGRRATGLHVSAAHRRAAKAYHVECGQLLTAEKVDPREAEHAVAKAQALEDQDAWLAGG